MSADRADYQAEAEQGIALCRQGDWAEGLPRLRRAARAEETRVLRGELPPLFYSYYGLGIAQYDRKIREGKELCERAAAKAFFQPEAYLNLALVAVLDSDRSIAVGAVQRGLSIDPDHPRLLRLAEKLGVRRRPVLPFLSRDNLLNRILGRWRHRRSQTKSQTQT